MEVNRSTLHVSDAALKSLRDMVKRGTRIPSGFEPEWQRLMNEQTPSLPHIVQCIRDQRPGVVLAWLIIAAVGVLVR